MLKSKFTFIIPNLGFGGTESWVIKISNALVYSGHQVKVVLVSSGQRDRISELQPSVSVIGHRKKSWLQSLQSLFISIKELEKNEKVFVLTERLSAACSLFRLLGFFRGRDISYRYSQMFEWSRKSHPYVHFFQNALIGINAIFGEVKIIFQNQAQSDSWRRECWYINRCKIKIILNPVSIKSILNSCKNRKKLLVVGRLEREKNINYCIDVMKSLPLDYSLDIYGSGSLAEQIKGDIDLSGLTNRVKIIKPVSCVAMNNYGFLLFSSEIDVMPNAVLEALAHGTPVAAKVCPGGISEIVNDYNGILLPSDTTPEEFGSHLVNAASKDWDCHLVKQTMIKFDIGKTILSLNGF